MKKMLIAVIAVWLGIVGVSFLWNMDSAREEQRQIINQTARTFLTQIILTRKWNADHGGVYVPVTADTQPILYLDDPLRDIQVNKSLTLTKINPSFMTRQISEIAAKSQGVQFHLTSLKPIRPQNRPSRWEKSALELFERGEKEVGEVLNNHSSTDFIYMVPLIAEKSCLKCHFTQGYKEGDIRGGISVTLSDIHTLELFPMIMGHIGIGSMGVLFILFFWMKLSSAYGIIQRQAVLDSLTGIPNRRYFSEQFYQKFSQCRREKTPISFILCDIDNFKEYNDHYGHLAGDKCLQRVAHAIKDSVLRSADFCARYGGEEFAVILPNTPIDGAMHIAEEIRLNVEHLNIKQDYSKIANHVTISVGAATVNLENISHEELIKKADEALYRAKKNGRNRVEA
ncbi:MAG: diguanylate cyclase [Deltaproteobacteria bacterium]|nr:MAG: diguanylate cyclase [Deltaproteobacteria bacterium]